MQELKTEKQGDNKQDQSPVQSGIVKKRTMTHSRSMQGRFKASNSQLRLKSTFFGGKKHHEGSMVMPNKSSIHTDEDFHPIRDVGSNVPGTGNFNNFQKSGMEDSFMAGDESPMR